MKTGLKLTLTASLLAGASSTALTGEARAAQVVFGAASLKGQALEPGRAVVLTDGVTQLRLDGGAMASFVGGAEFAVRSGNAIDLRRGTVTIASPAGAEVVVHMPNGVEGRLTGARGAAAFTAGADEARGHVMSGSVQVLARTGGTRSFGGGQFWRSGAQDGPSRIANAEAPAATPVLAGGRAGPAVAAGAASVPDLAAGPVAVAEAGLPVALGEALAAAGASGDVVAAARSVEASAGNPSLQAFPVGDYGTLVAYAAQLSGPYGGPAFAGAGPDIVRTYLQYLAGGGARETFLQSYAGLMLQYLDLVRSGAAPSSFSGASVQQINDFLAFQARTSGFAGLSSQNRALVDAYRAFLAGGGNPNAFARTYADLANAYFDYLRGGGSPAGFTGASQATVNAYLAFLRDSGMTGQLTPANRALLDAYLAGGAGLAFADQYRAALSAYYAHLVGGNLPSAYTPANAAQLRAYLETLESTGLLQGVLGAQADFFQAYLDHLQAGGAADAYAGLPANIFSGYAGALDAFRLHLAAGNLPSAYAGLPAATLRAYLEALASAGQLQRYLGANADFFGAYLEYLRTGGSADAWAGLPANIFSGYASALSAYSAFLAAGNLPSAYANVPPETLRAYLEALDAAGLLDRYLGASAGLLDAYLEHLRAGGGIDAFAGLPANIYAGYGAQLDAYYAFLANGGLPSAYTALSQAQIAAYLDALQASGALERFLGANAAFYASYRTFLAGGGNPDLFAGLPSPPDFPAYTAAVQAYAAYLRAGGLPSAYAELDAATIQRYLQALDTAGLLSDALLDAYLDHLRAGGVPEAFAGLPVYASYASALSAYYDFLAGGGLPSAYAALTPAQVTAYLQALSSAGVLDDLLASQQAFLSAYLAFVQNGGSPDRFAGLPVLASYGDALRAYLAYVAGGGLPSAYATLTPAQILAYLTALKEAGLLDAMLAGAPDGAAYAAYLLNGGAPDGFAGLPVLANYGAAVQAYLAFVAGGGLPSSYGALTPGQIVAYLTALRDAGLLDQLLAGAPAGAAYAAYLLNGGSPDRFPGLPVLATYGTAVQAYFTYIGGGGRPSQYGAATQSQIVDYINALEAAGLLATSYAAADRQLLLDYAAYVAGGNNPDQFAGLPPLPLTPLPAPNHAYAGGFTPSATHSYKAVTPTSAGQLLLTSQNNGVQMASNAQGQVTQLANMIRSDTSQVLDAAGNSSVVVGRWTGGSYIAGNQVVPVGAQSLHYYAAAPTTLAVPGAGRIDYAILAATQPTYDSGYGAAGLFDGALSIDFATRRAGLQGEIQMPEQGGPIAYAFTTAGGTAAPSAELTLTDPSSFAIGAAMTGSGRGCGGSCSLVFNGGFAGSSAENLGFVYYSVGSTVSDPIQGAVAFHGQQTGDGNPLPAPTYAYAPGLSGSSLRHIVDYARLSDGRRQSQISNGSAILSNGGATAIDSATGTDFYRDTAQQADVWGDERVLVGRWTNGNFRTGSATGPVQTLTQQSAVHYVLMQTPNFLMPYTGRIDYTLLAATRPTYIGGGTLPGIFDASLSIAFASTPRVGITGSIRMPESNGVVSYAFTSAGGTATPSVDLVIQPTDYFTFSTPFTGNGTACTGTCTITFNGSFSGADPLRVGMTYGTQGPQGQAGPQIHGAAAFAGAWVGAPQSLTRVSDRPFFSTALRNDTLNPGEGSTYDVNDLGQVVGLTSFNGLYDRLGGARIADSGSLAGNLVGWTRWTDGTLDTRRNGPPTPVTLAANGSYQIMHGAPLINMPTSGTASYTLIDGTQTADAFGAIGPGGVASGTARIAFGSTAKIGFDIHAQFNGNSYNLFTTGRTADVSASELTIAPNGRFNAFGPGGNVISTGSDCAGGACRPIWNGFLAGDGATGIGLHYRVQDTVARNLDFHGIAAFTRDGASAAAPSAKMAMAAPQWQDWAVASATVAAPGMAAPDMPGVAAPTIGAGSLDKLRERANEVLGGRVRF